MIKVLVQVEAGSREKHLYNEKTLEYKEARRVSRPYPYAYGFIVGTQAEDGDALDCYLITKDKVKCGSIVECEPIGLLQQVEDGEIDDKVLAAIPGQHVELDEALLNELQDFIYDIFSQFPGIHVKVGEILPREAALQRIEKFRGQK
jgi:inorganic pyrophosphatase